MGFLSKFIAGAAGAGAGMMIEQWKHDILAQREMALEEVRNRYRAMEREADRTFTAGENQKTRQQLLDIEAQRTEQAKSAADVQTARYEAGVQRDLMQHDEVMRRLDAKSGENTVTTETYIDPDSGEVLKRPVTINKGTGERIGGASGSGAQSYTDSQVQQLQELLKTDKELQRLRQAGDRQAFNARVESLMSQGSSSADDAPAGGGVMDFLKDSAEGAMNYVREGVQSRAESMPEASSQSRGSESQEPAQSGSWLSRLMPQARADVPEAQPAAEAPAPTEEPEQDFLGIGRFIDEQGGKAEARWALSAAERAIQNTGALPKNIADRLSDALNLMDDKQKARAQSLLSKVAA